MSLVKTRLKGTTHNFATDTQQTVWICEALNACRTAYLETFSCCHVLTLLISLENKQCTTFVILIKGLCEPAHGYLDLINSVQQVEAMVNSIQKGVENVLRK